MKGKYEKYSGRSSKVKPSCKCVLFVDKSVFFKKNSLVVHKGFLGVLHVFSRTTTPSPLKCTWQYCVTNNVDIIGAIIVAPVRYIYFRASVNIPKATIHRHWKK